jgi:hypothetical protein
VIPWRRYWVPLGGSISCGDDGQGFLDDPESDFGRHINPAVCELDTLLERSPLVLCGEPGIGKTTALRNLRAEIESAHDSVLWIDFRSIPDVGTFVRRTIETVAWQECQSSGKRLALVIDGVDEGLIKIPDFITFLHGDLKQFDLQRLQLILACRTAEWPTVNGHELIALWPDGHEHVFELCPLRLADARLAAEQFGADADRFLEAVFRNAVVGLAARPITLFFLLGEFCKTGAFPGTHRELYEAGCARLCSEEDVGRIESLRRLYPQHSLPSPAQIEKTASRIAALLLLTGKFAIHTGRPEDSNETDLHVKEIAKRSEQLNGQSFAVSEFVVLRTLASGLFTSRGENRFGFGHQTFAECLGARYLADVPSVQLTELICQRDGAEQHVVPQLAELAAWLVGYHSDFRNHVVNTEPELFLRCDVTRFDDRTKADLVQSLFDRVLKEQAFDVRGSRRFYGSFAHPKLADQLSQIIEDRSSNLVARRMALEIAAACKVTALAPSILKLLNDPSEECSLMRFAASALANVLPDDRIVELTPLAQREVRANEDYEVKAAALERLIPTLLKIRDAIPFIIEPDNEHYFGGYWSFLHYHVPKNVEAADILPLLEWLQNFPGCFGTLSWFKKIAEKTATEAIKHLDDKRILQSLVNLWWRRIREYGPLPSGDSDFAKYLAEYPDERRSFLRALLEDTTTAERDVGLLFTHGELFQANDFEWALDRLRAAQPSLRAKWAEIVALLARSPELQRCWDYFLSTLREVPELPSRFEWLRAWEIDEPLARKEKARWLKNKRVLERLAKRSEGISPKELVEHWLAAGSKGSASAWVPLSKIIFFKEGERHRSAFDADVTKAVGWLESDEQRRDAIRNLARRFLIEHEDRGTGSSTTNYTFAGYRAGVLLRDRMNDDPVLKKAFSEKWLMAVFDFPNNAEPLHCEMVKFAYHLDRDASLQKLYQDLLNDSESHGFLHGLQPFRDFWNSDLCDLVKHFARLDARPHSLDSLIEFLTKADPDCALECFQVLMDRVGPGNCDTEFVATFLAAAICNLPAQIWESVWSLVSSNEELARAVFIRVANHAGVSGDGVAAELSATQTADLFCLLTKLFPQEEEEPRSGTVTPRMDAGYLRDGQLRKLVAMATDDACRELARLARTFPKQRLWLNWQYRECLTAKRRKLWKPKPADIVLRLLESHKHRLIEDEDDLLELVVESLNRLQQSLTTGPNPEVGELWNYQGSGNNRRNFSPKDEEDISGKIAAWLQRDIGASSGVVLNREVQPRRGQRTDVLVDAVAGEVADKRRITVVMEVKGCWHAEVKTALETQLVATYLKPNGWTHGIYLVAWCVCQRWDSPDKPAVCKLRSQTIEDSATEVRELAAPFDGRMSPFRVIGYVLDCRYSN